MCERSFLAPSIFYGTTGSISDKYFLDITPSGWAFSIWGLIYFWLAASIVFCKNPTHKIYPDTSFKMLVGFSYCHSVRYQQRGPEALPTSGNHRSDLQFYDDPQFYPEPDLDICLGQGGNADSYRTLDFHCHHECHCIGSHGQTIKL